MGADGKTRSSWRRSGGEMGEQGATPGEQADGGGGGWGQKANACPAGEPRSPRPLSFLRPRTVCAPTRLTRHRASAGNRRSWRVRESAAGQVGECGGSSAARTRPRPPPSLSHA